MKTVYKVLAYLIAVEVVVQAAVMVYAISGLGLWITDGGVLDEAAFMSGESLFPEMIGLIIHGMNGMMVIPALALILLIVSFFAKVPRGVAWAAAVLGLVVLQVALGLGGHSVSISGLLHGLNAFALFTVALLTARRVTRTAGPVVDAPVRARAMS